MNLNKQASSKINIISSLVWASAAVVLAIIFALNHDMTDRYIQLVIGLFIIIALLNLAGVFSVFHRRKILDIINWGIFQSAILIISAFAARFPTDNRKAFWLGIAAITALYATTRLSSAWLNKKFENIEKL
ncbi:MAG: hypothetical protein GX028_08830 [Clostridiaceae bacterium]|nr:hypothetical protein [Clostridiaceae bacterium]